MIFLRDEVYSNLEQPQQYRFMIWSSMIKTCPRIIVWIFMVNIISVYWDTLTVILRSTKSSKLFIFATFTMKKNSQKNRHKILMLQCYQLWKDLLKAIGKTQN